MTEDALIARAQRGDETALGLLLHQNYLAVRKYLVTVTLDRPLAEDLTQETMIRAIQRIGQFGGRSRFSTWLISIATRLYCDWLRKQGRETRLQQALAFLPMEEPDAPAEERLDLLQRLAALPRDVALPLVLKHYHGYTYAEIGEWMGIPEGTVKSRVHHGLAALRKEMAPHDANG